MVKTTRQATPVAVDLVAHQLDIETGSTDLTAAGVELVFCSLYFAPGGVQAVAVVYSIGL